MLGLVPNILFLDANAANAANATAKTSWTMINVYLITTLISLMLQLLFSPSAFSLSKLLCNIIYDTKSLHM